MRCVVEPGATGALNVANAMGKPADSTGIAARVVPACEFPGWAAHTLSAASGGKKPPNSTRPAARLALLEDTTRQARSTLLSASAVRKLSGFAAHAAALSSLLLVLSLLAWPATDSSLLLRILPCLTRRAILSLRNRCDSTRRAPPARRHASPRVLACRALRAGTFAGVSVCTTRSARNTLLLEGEAIEVASRAGGADAEVVGRDKRASGAERAKWRVVMCQAKE